MRHDRHAARGQEGNRLGHVLATLKLHGRGAGFGHQARGIAEGLLRAFFIGPEGHVDDRHRLGQAAHHRPTMQDHHLHRHAQRRGHAMQHHADGVTHQRDVAVPIDDSGNRRGIGGQHHQRGTTLARLDVGGQDRA